MPGTVGQTATGTISNIVDGSGNPVTPKSTPTWTTSDPSILTLTPSTDGMSASGVAAKAGTVIVIATVDSVVKTVSVDVVSGAVADFTLDVSFGNAALKRK